MGRRNQIVPRGWQVEALSRWEKSFRGTVRVVTGGGKTIFSFFCLKKFHEIWPEGKAIIVVPTTALLDQWYLSLAEDFGIPEEEIACFSGEEKSEVACRFNLIVLNTARELAPALATEGDWILIVDECHRAGSRVNANALQGNYRAALGLSATPIREQDAGFDEYIEPILGPIIYDYSYAQAYRDGIICPFSLVNVHVPLLPSEQKEYDKITKQLALALRKNGDGPIDEKIKHLLRKRARVSAYSIQRIPVTCYLVEQHPIARSIIFHESVAIAQKITSILSQRKHRATSYHTKIGPAIRRSNLVMFRNGLFDILVSCRALDEGANIPETSVAIIAASTSSIRQRIQRLGRVLRPAPGKSNAIIYTLFSTEIEKRRLQDEEANFRDIASVMWVDASI